jgi:hypothetical protein
MKTELAFKKILARSKLILVAVFVIYVFHASSADVSSVLSPMSTNTNSRPDARRELPPVMAGNFSVIENWLASCGWPWSKQELVFGKRKLVCVDLAPYSGQPARHLFVYQVLDHSVGLLFCSIVWNPPKQGVGLQCDYEKNSDSLTVRVAGTNCLTVKLTNLWCD